MWSMFSQDFSDFAKAFKSESAGFVDYLGHMASDVVGRGDVYAGDEVLKKTAQSMPLPNELLRRLQEAESTYALPIQPEEKAAFAEWVKVNPLSSLNAQRRQAAAAVTSPAEEVSAKTAATAMTPNRRSTEWPDEPIDETRQRLLDYNEVVLQRYMALVGDGVSPRSSMPASPATPDTRRRLVDPPSAVKFDHDDESNNTSNSKDEISKGATVSAAAVKPPLAPSSSPASPSPVKVARVMSEDDFFDRYFFRLTQLRVSEAQRRRDRAAAEMDTTTTTGAADSMDVSPVPSSTQRAGRRAAEDESVASSGQTSPQTNVNDVSRQTNNTNSRNDNDDDDDFVAVPLFAKRMMTAASGFVTNIDNALNGVVAAETSRCSGDGGSLRRLNSEDESANVDPSELVHFRGAKQQIADLESLVQELQEALRQERRRVHQLTAVLEAHNIEIPAEEPTSVAGTPAKHEGAATSDTAAAAAAATSAATATPQRHVETTTATTSAGASPANAAAADVVATPATKSTAEAEAEAAAAKTAEETSRVSDAAASPAADASTSSAAKAGESSAEVEKASGVISAGSEEEAEEEDDEAWVNVNPSAEQSAS